MLTLQIKKKWLDMILSGEKTEEYRTITHYWTKRFKNILLLNSQGIPIGVPRMIKLRAGYRKNAPEAKVRVSISKGTGKPEWGAEPGTVYWILTIKEVVKQCRKS